MSIVNKIFDRILNRLPEDLGFRNNKNDPLNIILSGGARMLREGEDKLESQLDNLSIENMDPNLALMSYYVTASFFSQVEDPGDVFDVTITENTTYNGTAEVVETNDEFLSNKITGIGRDIPGNADETIDLSTVIPSGIIGLSYGFDWEDPSWYVTKDETSIDEYNADFSELESSTDVSTRNQSYSSNGYDEYLNFEIINVNFTEAWEDTAVEKRISLNGFVVGMIILDFTTEEPQNPKDYEVYMNTVTGISSETTTSVNATYIYTWDSGSSSWIAHDTYVLPKGIKVTTIIDEKEYNTEFTVEQSLDGTSELIVAPFNELESQNPIWWDGENDYPSGRHYHYNRDARLNIEYTHKIATLEHAPISEFNVIDIYDIDPATGDGNILTPSYDSGGDFIIEDYLLVDNQVYLRTDNDYNSRYIVEYNYEISDRSIYLTQEGRMHYIGLKGSPLYKLG